MAPTRGRPARRSPARAGVRATAVAAALTLAGGLAAACGAGQPTAAQVAASYLADWAKQDWPAMHALTSKPPASFAAVNAAARAGIGVRAARYTAGTARVTGTTARVPVTQQLTLAGTGPVTVHSVLTLRQSAAGAWRVAWTPATIAPGLQPGGHLAAAVSWPARAQILGAGEMPLTTQAAMVTIGVEGQRVKSAPVVKAALLAAGAPAAAVTTALAGAAAHPTWFEPVFTVSSARYAQLEPSIYPVPGTVFQRLTDREPLTPGLGYVIGATGPPSAAQLTALGPPYAAGDLVGQSGLESAAQRQLAGQPGVTITAVNDGGHAVSTVATLAPRPGLPLQTSIDPQVQQAAEQALAGVAKGKQAALIAVDAATGQILAVANKTPGQLDLALSGEYPPGSSFKVLTSTALMQRGLTPSSPASCPPQITAGGQVFHNAEGDQPAPTLLAAFAESCNTAFIGLAESKLSAADFRKVAALYRLGVTPQAGLPAYAGSVPAPPTKAALAATSIGQSRVLVSPLDMAMVAAAADTGQVRAPRLVTGAPDDKVAPAPLPAAVVRGLHTLMASVVASGTAAGTGLPPGTFAKTGTAQYGSGNPLPTDAWLIGFNNQVAAGQDIAFAMVTVDGGNGGPADGPVVAKFLRLLRQPAAEPAG